VRNKAFVATTTGAAFQINRVQNEPIFIIGSSPIDEATTVQDVRLQLVTPEDSTIISNDDLSASIRITGSTFTTGDNDGSIIRLESTKNDIRASLRIGTDSFPTSYRPPLSVRDGGQHEFTYNSTILGGLRSWGDLLGDRLGINDIIFFDGSSLTTARGPAYEYVEASNWAKLSRIYVVYMPLTSMGLAFPRPQLESNLDVPEVGDWFEVINIGQNDFVVGPAMFDNVALEDLSIIPQFTVASDETWRFVFVGPQAVNQWMGQKISSNYSAAGLAPVDPIYEENDPIFTASAAADISSTDITNWDTAYGWGNHASAGYLTSYTETDPTVPSHVKDISSTQITNWDAAYGWGNHASAGYLTSISGSNLSSISIGALSDVDVTTNAPQVNQVLKWNGTNWVPAADAEAVGGSTDADTLDGQDGTFYLNYNNFTNTPNLSSFIDLTDLSVDVTAASGNGSLSYDNTLGKFTFTPPSLSGYLTSYTETDPVFVASAAHGITTTLINDWTSAYAWGDHSTAGYLTSSSLTGYATESYVTTQISNIIDTAPEALNTLNELAAALGDDANFASTTSTALGNRLRIDVDTQGLTTQQKTNAVTNLGLATVATSGSYNDLTNKPARGPAQATTSVLANNASENATVTGHKSYFLMKIQTSAAAWVRVYTTSAARTSDASRTQGQDPNPGAGVIAEIITTGAQTVLMSPGVLGFNDESTPTTDSPITVTNLSGGNSAITVTLTLLKLES
jgi:hypothetical protein